MPVTTTSAAFHITPVVVKTLLVHGKKKAKRIKNASPEESPQDDLVFDEAFHIVKAFIDFSTRNTIESLQAFTNTHVPAPYWATVCPVTIPLSSCNTAADALIEWFGPEELKLVVGGERWWQVRGLSGIDAEWVAEEKHLGPELKDNTNNKQKLSKVEVNIKRMETLDTVMNFSFIFTEEAISGVLLTRIAIKYNISRTNLMGGLSLLTTGAVLHFLKLSPPFLSESTFYRKAPQYPWPCALQDVIAAYLYLIRPPLGSPHQAVSHSKIVFAGDSAGGGLCVTVLTVLRDLGLPMPAGAVLISPWVDLTHSFPSVMQNFKTDIIPEYGFLSKPSTLWPVPTIPDTGGRVVPTMTNDPPKPGKPDTLKPTLSRVQQTEEHKVHAPEEFVKSQREMLDSDEPSFSKINSGNHKREDQGSPSTATQNSAAETSKEAKDSTLCNIDYWEPKPPKVLMENPDAVPLELRSQIQMYAATEQLIHPLVSPILQGSLGNLPPLYIITGDGEVLRDEIIYLAHKAAHPTVYPTREGVVRESNRQKENVEKFTMPTNVHLQVFDGMCHVLTVFTFTKSAKYAYWSVAEFIKHVSKHDEEHLRLHPFPERSQSQKAATPLKKYGSESDVRRPSTADSETKLYTEKKSSAGQRSDEHIAHSKSTSAIETDHRKNATPDAVMVRERVNLSGQVRPMEPPEALQALQLKASDIGVIKEAPALRWAEGQRKWDERYSRDSKRVLKQKAHYEAKAEHLVKNALHQGFVHKSHGGPVGDPPMPWTTSTSVGKIQPDRRWGPLDLQDERPPPTAIAGRRDTPEAVALLKKSIYNTAPVTHLTVPKLKTSDAIRAAFDPNDDPNKPPTQSVSEEQVKARFIWMHGLRMWDGLLRYIGKKSAGKAADGINATAEMVGLKTTSNDP